MRILALDLGTRIGWAFGHVRDGPTWGFHDLPRTGDNLGRYVIAFDGWLDDMLDRLRPDIVVKEGPVDYMSNALVTKRKLWALDVKVEEVCVRHDVECCDVHNQEVKRFFTGAGGKKGGRMIEAARARGWKTADHNAADALGVWLFMVALLDVRDRTQFAMQFGSGLKLA